jgi:hypothetical protein
MRETPGSLRWLGRAFIVTMLASFLGGCSQPKQSSAPTSKVAGDLTVTFTTSTPPPHSGDDTGIITIVQTATGQPVSDASVVATANMTGPKADGAPASGRSQGSGRYEVPLRLIATTYDIDVHIERPGQPAVDVTFPIDVWQ